MKDTLDASSGEPEPAVPAPLWSRLLNIYAAPGEAFDAVKTAKPSAANYLVPALLLMVVGWLGGYWIFSQDAIRLQITEISDQAIERQVERGQLPREGAENARAAAEKVTQIMTRVGVVAGPIFMGLVAPLWWALIFWLLGRWAFRVELSYFRALEVAGLSTMIHVLSSVVGTLMIVSLGNLFAGPHLGLLIEDFDSTNPAHALLMSLSLMTLWLMAIRAVGLAKVTGVSLGRATGWVFGLWILGRGLLTGLSFLGTAVGSRMGS